MLFCAGVLWMPINSHHWILSLLDCYRSSDQWLRPVDVDGVRSEFFWNISESVLFELFRVTLCTAGVDSVFVQHDLIVLFVVLRVLGWRRSVIQTMVITSLRSHRRQWIHALCIKIFCDFTYRSGGSRSDAVLASVSRSLLPNGQTVPIILSLDKTGHSSQD